MAVPGRHLLTPKTCAQGASGALPSHVYKVQPNELTTGILCETWLVGVGRRSPPTELHCVGVVWSIETLTQRIKPEVLTKVRVPVAACSSPAVPRSLRLLVPAIPPVLENTREAAHLWKELKCCEHTFTIEIKGFRMLWESLNSELRLPNCQVPDSQQNNPHPITRLRFLLLLSTPPQ